MDIAVIGAGSAGQAVSGFLAISGHSVRLFSRSARTTIFPKDKCKIVLRGEISGEGSISCFTDDIVEAIVGAELILVTTTADAHKQIARQIAPFLVPNQVIVLNPGRTLGAVEVKIQIEKINELAKDVVVGETQSLLYACRARDEFGLVEIFARKSRVLIASYPKKSTDRITALMNSLFGCFEAADGVFITSMENIGAVLHPPLVLFKASSIENAESQLFYADITPSVTDFLLRLDEERLNIGKAWGKELRGIESWLSWAYRESHGSDLRSKISKNPAYSLITAPKTLNHRFIMEDVPTGLVPMAQIGKLVRVNTPLICSVIDMCSNLTGNNFWETGRSIEKLGLSVKSRKQLLEEL